MSKRTRAINIPLFLGLLVTGFTLFIAFAGPGIAPRNPLEEKRVIQVDGGKFINAPYPPFKVPGYPLGSDSNGRDVLSQVLWALRPTLMLVGYVALLRLLVGTVLGLLAGWHTNNRIGALINGLIGASLSMPILMVALAVVALTSATWQPWSFVLGLLLTGWADSARLVREQTRITRGQLFVEASRALGQNNFEIVVNHILRQVLPFIWMLLAFEISSTLLVTAGLGFLGYYVGGEVWIWISDTEAARLGGMPELGQMLSGVNEDIYTSPWKLFASGTLIFITVLGFNLLGEGLRRVDSHGAPSSRLFDLMNNLRWHIDEAYLSPLKQRMRERPLASAAVIIILAVLMVFGFQQARSLSQPKPVAFSAPGGHLWAGQWRDPSATMYVPAPGVDEPQVLWTFGDESGLAGGPAVSVDGSVYLLSKDGTLHSLDPGGSVNWSVSIPSGGVGTPALDAEGNIHVADMQGGLTSFTPGGELRWRFQVDGSFEATGGPIVGASGVIYYVVAGDIRAVSPQGELLWGTTAFNRRVSFPPILSPNEDFVFLRNTILDAASGDVVTFDSLPTAEQYIVGLNGLLYSRFENQITGWEYADGQAQPRSRMNWSRTAFFGFPGLAGVLADGSMWLHYDSEYEDSSLVWIDKEGNLINRARFALRPSSFAGMDEGFNFYICGSKRTSAECISIPKNQKDARWTLTLGEGRMIAGLALIPERLYVATDEGFFYAIGNLEE
jgi:peptide/nickel transport system permease protein